MLHFFAVILFALVVSVAGQGPTEPCAQLSALQAAAKQSKTTTTYDAQLGLSCLKSIPIHKENSSALVASLVPYVNWQSSLSYIKAPPAGYEQLPTDVLGGLKNIMENISADKYTSEYDYQADIFSLVTSVKDQHFRFLPDILAGAVSFKRNVGLVSVSMDGVELPKVYMLNDMKAFVADPKSKPSAIKNINGMAAPTFLENESLHSFQTGKDAGYNAMLYSAASNHNPNAIPALGNFGGDANFQYYYPGANTTLEYENGTMQVIHTAAVLKTDFTGVTDGESLYQKIVIPELSPQVASNQSTTTPTPSGPPAAAPPPPRMQGYPEPNVVISDLKVGGYYLDGAHNDTAVLTLLDFKPKNPIEYQAGVQSFLANAKRDGKTKMIVDLSTNTGGLVTLAHDAFRQFFPNTTEFSHARFRESPGFNQLVQYTNQVIPKDFNYFTSPDFAIASIAVDHFNYRYDINATRQPFQSFDAEFAPNTFNGDKFSALSQYDYNNPLVAANSTTAIGTDITGYRSRKNFTQPFPASNIVLLHDGQCGSSCSMFSLNMQILGGVKSVAMGGRPNKNTMQGIGGTRGSLAFSYSDIYSRAQALLQVLPPSTAANLTDLNAITTLPILRSFDNELGVRDQILPDHIADGVPAQVLNIPSDCRLYYTPESALDVSKMWAAVADSAFNGKGCNVGSISNGTKVKRGEGFEEPRHVLVRKAEDSKNYFEEARKETVSGRFTSGQRKLDGKALPKFDYWGEED